MKERTKKHVPLLHHQVIAKQYLDFNHAARSETLGAGFSFPHREPSIPFRRLINRITVI
jgi:hypothetical protein